METLYIVVGCAVLLLLVLFGKSKQHAPRAVAVAPASDEMIRKRQEAYDTQVALAAGPQVSTLTLMPEEHVIFDGIAERVYFLGTDTVVTGPTIAVTRGGAKGAIVGGLLAGGPGAIAGFATSPKTTVSHTPTKLIDRRQIDSGKLTITDRRVVFVGNNESVAIPLSEILEFTAVPTKPSSGSEWMSGENIGNNKIQFKRVNAPSQEYFAVRNFVCFTWLLNKAGYSQIQIPPRPSSPVRWSLAGDGATSTSGACE